MQSASRNIAPLRKRVLSLCSVLILGGAAAGTAQADAILHAFNWRYADVEARAAKKRQGCPAVPEKWGAEEAE